jgi:hypothetical protein
MRADKARGLVTKFPVGRKPGVSGRTRSKDKTIARAQRVLEDIAMGINRNRSLLPLPAPDAAAALPTRPLTQAAKLANATDLALDIVQQILKLGVDPSDVRLLAQVKDTALTVIGQAIRLGESELRMREPAARGGSVEEFYRRYEGGSSEESER